ncbi:MAG: tRNA uridine-5-carboxymethylaminomethyl(34) synthesis GTPase MnmE [Desulfonauticus sp.]|nr:tRNA uridine-5-carboxymethylaminomethyl(34) synthesis GTPase MnmE [Desulfonauticus sp.]
MQQSTDTIAAIVTPLGKGGVGIIRLSGAKSLVIGQKFFSSAKKDFTCIKPYRLHHGYFVSLKGEVLDEILLAYMPAPGSYTGEDVVEINCHGGPAVLQSVLEEVLKAGARLANPGEFTYRAFLNHKIDLTQAEAVMELINAPTQAAIPLAQKKLQGLLQQKIASLRTILEELKQDFCVAVDFPEEDLECAPPHLVQEKVQKVLQEINSLIESYRQKHLYQDGALVVLTGRVNAGKSSLLNALLGRERAIVTSIPGTTRDYLEEYVNFKGLPIKLIDTAGLRETQDEIEQIGLQRGLELIQKSDLCLLLVDIREKFTSYEQKILELKSFRDVFLLLTKVDLSSKEPSWVKTLNLPVFKISSATGEGISDVIDAIVGHLSGDSLEATSDLVPNLRQKNCLQKAYQELENLLTHLGDLPYDLLAVHLDLACRYLQEITGEITTDEVLNNIFQNFCIGK